MGYVSPGRAMIGGVATAPGLPLASSPLSGLYQLTNGLGFAFNQLNYATLNALGGSFGNKPNLPFTFTLATAATPVGATPYKTTISPDGLFLYQANAGGNSISAFSINPTTGALTAVPGSPFACANNPVSVALSPDGKWLCASIGSVASTAVYSRNTLTGVLTPAVGSPFATPSQYECIFSPDGAYLVTANYAVNSVSVYSFNDSTGAITPIAGSPFALVGINPRALSFLGNQYLAVANNGSANVTVLAYNASTGVLSAIPNNTYAVGASPTGMWYVPGNATTGFLYVSNTTSNSISAFMVETADGDLFAVTGSPFATGAGPYEMAATSDGQYLIVANNGGNNASAYSINNTTGALTPITGSPFATGNGPFGVAVAPGNLYAYISNATDSTLTTYRLSATAYNLINMTYDPTSGLGGVVNINGNLLIQGGVVLTIRTADTRYAQLAGNIAQNFAVKLLTTDHAAGGIAGTPTNDNAVAGSVGEYIESTVAARAAVALTTGVVANVTSIALTAGDWDVEGIVNFHSSGTTNVNDATAGVSSVSATQGGVGTYITDYLTIVIPAAPDPVYAAPKTRISLAAPATIYLIAMSHFTVSTLSAYGHISARRVR